MWNNRNIYVGNGKNPKWIENSHKNLKKDDLNKVILFLQLLFNGELNTSRNIKFNSSSGCISKSYALIQFIIF